jgi:hypothetical protein
MSSRIVVLCDFHQSRDEDVPGQPVDLAIRANGGAFRFLTVDLCDVCRKGLDDVFAEVEEHGREFDGDPAKAVGKRKGRPKSSETERTCVECQRVFSQPSDMRKHLKAVHEIQPDSLSAEEFECEDCGQTFTTPQGRGAHRRIHATA